jgi:hypothetical protein
LGLLSARPHSARSEELAPHSPKQRPTKCRSPRNRATQPHVAVELNFGGKTKRRRFSPATTVGVVTEWARKKFRNLDPAAVAEYVSEICGTSTQPRPTEHLGELVCATTCSICFNLVKEVTPQG